MKLSKNIALSKDFVEEFKKYVNANPLELLHIPHLRKLLTQERLNSITSDNFEVLKAEDAQKHTLEHNLSQLRKLEAWQRPLRLIFPLVSIDYVYLNSRKLKVLTVGPRSEAEIFHLLSYGFNMDNITGLDLISYSNYVDVGDAHDMPYEDNSFDIIIVGWVFAYSSDNQKMADEIVRVAKPGAFISVGCRTHPITDPEQKAFVGSQVGGVSIAVTYDNGITNTASRFVNTEQILRLFNNNIGELYFNHNPHPSKDGDYSDAIVVFRLV